MNLIKKNLLTLFLVFFMSLVPVFMLYADSSQPINVSEKITNPLSINTVNGFIKAILEGLIKLGIPLIALAIIYSGFLFVFARGNSEKITKAKDALLYTLIGAVLLIGSWALAQLISNTVLAL